MRRIYLFLLVTLAFSCVDSFAYQAETCSWQKPHAKVLPNGNLEWAPEPFKFVTGNQIRYIDYENGDDTSDGKTKHSPWKHHPWDSNATGKAAACEGPITYVFRRGVIYRGGLAADESGKPNAPIILTASALDEDSPYYWGDGEAYLFGSTKLPPKWGKATEVKHPERIPEPEKVWALNLNGIIKMKEDKETGGLLPALANTGAQWERQIAMPFLGLYRRKSDGSSHRQHLARTPDWQQGNDNFVLDYWHIVDRSSSTLEKDAQGKPIQGGLIDEDVLKGHPEDWFAGGYIWPQYAHFMGTPRPRRIELTGNRRGLEYKVYDPEQGALNIGGIYGEFRPGLRYIIENLPQYLDAEEEYYFDNKSAYLFYIPPEGRNPNEMDLEFTTIHGGIRVPSQSHILINGFTLRYYDGQGIGMSEDVEDVTVRNCIFEDLLADGLTYSVSNWRGGKPSDWADGIYVADCLFKNVASLSLNIISDPHNNRRIGHVEVLRNRIYSNGMRHRDNVQSSVEALRVSFPRTAIIAGNIVERSFGTGIMVHGGASGAYKYPDRSHTKVDNFPLTRILVYQNKTVDTALGVNDYGGMSLWQGGSIYCYNNNIGNSPGVMPGGISWFKTPPTNLSYPLYLDGAYKVYSFNNIIWARSNDLSRDKYATKTPGYFMVFGFLNHLVNNTLYRTGEGVGGSAGYRNDVIGNIFSEVGYVDKEGRPQGKFIANDRTGDPSLVGGGDTGDSGRRGVPTLAFANNIFYGPGTAGCVLKPGRFGPDSPGVEADTVPALAKTMQDFPIRVGQLGRRADSNPIRGKAGPAAIADISEADFRPTQNSMAIDSGVRYFIPWSLYGTVGEWHFTENYADPMAVIDYAWYMCEPHYHRMMYEFVPTADLTINNATLDDYVASPSEDWVRGAVRFDGQRYASVSDKHLHADILLPAYPRQPDGQYGKQRSAPPGPLWQIPDPVKMDGGDPVFAQDAVFTFQGEERRTLAISTQNLLVEANFKTDLGHKKGTVLAKHDGKSGYRLITNAHGQAEFQIASAEQRAAVATRSNVNDGKWHHVLAEVDRKSGRMTIYLDGEESNSVEIKLPTAGSLDNKSDFLVGKAHDNSMFFRGAIDFMRVCQGTLADAQTAIAELYEWQTNGPFKYDMMGNASKGARRDAGALELR